MKEYCSYQPTSVHWANRIPSHWKTIQGKRLATPFSGKEVVDEAEFDGTYPVYGSGGPFKKTNLCMSSEVAVAFGRKGTIGKPIYIQEPFWAVDTMYYALTNQSIMSTRYLFYMLQVLDWEPFTTKTAIPSIVANDVFNTKFIVPPRSEQDQIVRYLDWQVSKINRLIAAKRKEIKLLELATAHRVENILHEGTRKEVLIETGNPWISMAPASWKKLRHKNVLSEKKEVVGDNYSQYTLLSLTTKGVIVRDISSGKGKFPSDFSTYQVVKPTDMVFCLFDVDETPRTVGLSDKTGMVTGAYTVYETHDALPEYLLYYFTAIDNKKGFKPLYSGLRKVVGKEVFARQAIFLPSLEEQKEIVEEINTWQGKYRKAIELFEREIDALVSLRTRLISDIVTGQVDVRGIEVPNFQMTHIISTDNALNEKDYFDDEERQVDQ